MQNTKNRSYAQISDYGYRPATIECVIAAAQRQNVPANVLLGIASIEMGANGDRIGNSNKSLDLGHFGINTVHFRPGGLLANAGIRPEDVASRGCYNAEVAAWLLARCLREQRGADFWVWAANYHSATPKFNAAYRQKLIRFSAQWGRWLQYRYPQVSIYQPHPLGDQQ
ncbi:hypothetical protein BAU07_26140 (plasmid) [Bordetella flabilis]|uniref:Conjugal transfer protein TrbN n=1 Tax=Bordetella flabilis TaxID=463014 RepID=A0A193GLC6_9BORD|nr:hypothetical protein BAU07_26140 [Bordetella flabilis]